MIDIKASFDESQLSKLNDAIKRVAENMKGESLLRGAQKAGAFLEGEAKKLCVVDTGRLRSSITHSVDANENGISIVIGTNVEYAPYVEFGTGPKGEASTSGKDVGASISYRKDGWVFPIDGSFRYTKGQPARPFLYPALINNKANVVAIIENELKK